MVFFGAVSLTLVSQHTLIAALCRCGRRFNVLLPRVQLLLEIPANKQCLITTRRRDEALNTVISEGEPACQRRAEHGVNYYCRVSLWLEFDKTEEGRKDGGSVDMKLSVNLMESSWVLFHCDKTVSEAQT